jgi:CHAT domain-containing protein
MGAVNQQSEHLSSAQIEQYGNPASGAGPETDAWVEKHLSDCPACRSRVLEFQRAQLALLPDSKVNTVPTSACPSEDNLRDLAAGLCDDSLASQLQAHAAGCEHCGPLLREYLEDFSDDITAEEQAFLEQLRTASPEGRRLAASKMLQEARRSNPSDPVPATEVAGAQPANAARPTKAGSQTPPRRFFSWKWIMVPAAAAACTVLAFTVWYAQRDTPEKVERLLAKSYTEQRPMEMRWPGAEWAKYTKELGPSESVFPNSDALFNAEKMIREHGTASRDSKWLRAKAEAEILEDRPQNAIKWLDPTGQATPDSVPLMLDLALAYALQFRDSGQSDWHALLRAINLLEKALQKEPENRTALFNLALAYADNHMLDKAISTWEQYLRIETDQHWKDEANTQLKKAVEERDNTQKKPHSTSYYSFPPSDQASTFLDLDEKDIAFRLEQYQEIALRSWLAKAVAGPSGLEHKAVERLALISKSNSSDRWWLDFLHAASSRDVAGVEALSAAFEDNKKGFYAKAMDQSVLAQGIFKHQNLAGELRAQLEIVYAQRRLLKGQTCLDQAQQLLNRLAGTRYTWLQVQVGMELAVCLNYADQLQKSGRELSRSLSLSQQSKLPIAALRNIGFRQSLDNQQGNYGDALEEGVKGLHEYWLGPPSTERIYQFYTGFSRSAQALGLWAAAEAFMRHAIDLLQGEEDDIQKGAAWLELSKILSAESEDAAAEAAALKANQLLDRQIAEPSAEIYRLVGKIGLAELQLQHGKKQEALKTLALARDLPETDPYFVSLTFHRLAGNVNRQLRRLDQAESEYHEAILKAERALPGLEGNRRRLDWIAASEDAYRGLVRILIERNKPEDAWKVWEWYISRPYSEELPGPAGGNSHPAAGWPQLWDVISAIHQQPGAATRLVYAVFDDGIEIWSVGRDKPKGTWVPARREDLQHMAQQFSQACARRDSSLAEIQNLGQELFALLVQPVSKELPAAPLISVISVELDRSLSGLPIEALRSPEGWYLGEKYPIVQSPGVQYEGLLREPVNLSSSAQFLLADAAEKSFLPGHDLERSTIQKLFSKKTVLGPEADGAAIMAPLAESSIFGFIGHGEPHGTGTGLRINPRLLLQAEDFSAHSLQHLQIAVLAACSTGSGGDDSLLDNRNLVHAFLAGGVPSVVASRWNVDAEATAILMSNFYSGYAGHQSAPDALFSARNQLLKSYSHPYYWAGFSVTGKVN